MNPLTHFKKIRIVPLLIAPALVIIAVLAAVPARATPSCGLTNTNLLSPVPAGFFPDGLLDLMCRELPGTAPVVSPHERQGRFGRLCHPSHVPAGGSDWVAQPSRSQPDHSDRGNAHGL